MAVSEGGQHGKRRSSEENAGLRPPVGRDLIHEAHGSLSVAGGVDVGTERAKHEQRTPSRYPGDIPRSKWGDCLHSHVEQGWPSFAQGSGFLISKDGRVVTNYHVIKSGRSAVIKLPDGASFPVEGVLVSDKHRDVAIIKARGSNFRTLVLGDSDRLQVGEGVVAIGNPLSLE